MVNCKNCIARKRTGVDASSGLFKSRGPAGGSPGDGDRWWQGSQGPGEPGPYKDIMALLNKYLKAIARLDICVTDVRYAFFEEG